MRLNRFGILSIFALALGASLVGCSTNEPFVDAPLVTDAPPPPPPPRPNKLSPSISGVGGSGMAPAPKGEHSPH